MRKKRKIFRPKRRYRIKHANTGAIKVVTGLAALSVLVFVGYSAAGPVSSYLEERAQKAEMEAQTSETTDFAISDFTFDLSEPEETAPSQTETTPVQTTLPAEETEESETRSPSYGHDMEILFGGGEEDDTSGFDGVNTNDYDYPAETEVKTETKPAQTPVSSAALSAEGAAVMISEEEMDDMESLEAALDEAAKTGASAVILPMKTEGGIYHYRTFTELAATVCDGEDPIKSDLTAIEIANAAKLKGLRPVALVSVLTDNNRYGDYRDGSYRSLDDSTWLDAAPDNGGKPWISPFDETAVDYLCDIMTELGEAGFTEIIADDFIFPDFREKDIELLGEQVGSKSERQKAITSLACKMTEAGRKSGAEVVLRITANSVLRGYSELFAPAQLEGCTVLIDLSDCHLPDTMNADGTELDLNSMDEYTRVTAIFTEINRRGEGVGILPLIEKDSMSPNEYSAALTALGDMGYSRYYIY
ncbi:MAG: putative glycoside hydrolase [Huintestinicola sp.]